MAMAGRLRSSTVPLVQRILRSADPLSAIRRCNGRLRHIETIGKRFTELTMAYRGEVKATITTVIPVPAEEEKELKETLLSIIELGKKVKIEQEVDPNILGGIVVEFGQNVFDMSINFGSL